MVGDGGPFARSTLSQMGNSHLRRGDPADCQAPFQGACFGQDPKTFNLASQDQCSCRAAVRRKVEDLVSQREWHDTPKLLGKTIASQGSRHRDRQPCLAQALRRKVMAMVEQMILRPGDTKPAIAENAHWLFRCDGRAEIGTQPPIPGFTDLNLKASTGASVPARPRSIDESRLRRTLRRPQERTEHPRKALTFLQVPRALRIARFFIST